MTNKKRDRFYSLYWRSLGWVDKSGNSFLPRHINNYPLFKLWILKDLANKDTRWLMDTEEKFEEVSEIVLGTTLRDLEKEFETWMLSARRS